ncbi:hypothetical protein [Actinoallomurus liliacearum]|uniref:hypothetical protein n=1 Tax=Actinoallomurus liliacearum TaxID=1080073 RepID=UPI0031EB39B6
MTSPIIARRRLAPAGPTGRTRFRTGVPARASGRYDLVVAVVRGDASVLAGEPRTD